MRLYAIRLVVALGMALAASTSATSATTVPSHCTTDERVVFSCQFKNGKTASLCASPDLDREKGILQYRFGMVGKKPELTFPDLDDTDDPEKYRYEPGERHPKYWFHWYSSYKERLPNGALFFGGSNTKWDPKNLPKGYTVSTSLDFSPIEGNPSIGFMIVSETGPDSVRKGVRLSIIESVGKGRDLAHLYCPPGKTIDELFSLKDIIRR